MPIIAQGHGAGDTLENRAVRGPEEFEMKLVVS